jgi:heptosyltransferase-2
MAWLAGIPVRIGLATDRRGWLLTHPVPFRGGLAERHHLEIFLEVARAAGCAIDDPRPFFHVGDEDHAWADAFLSERNAGRFPFLLALHVGASKRPRGWHRERFAEAALQIAESRDGGVVLLGAKDDQEEMDQVEARIGGRALNACGRSTIKQMAALIARCSLFLGNDSGPMHLAGALGVPVVAIFGPGDPERTAPRPLRGREGSVMAVSRRYPCSPCRQAFFRECYPSPAGKPMCLESIGVDEVVGAAGALLADSVEP